MPNSSPTLVDVHVIVRLQDDRTGRWHETGADSRLDVPAQAGLEHLIEAQHAANYMLWHAEDEARRPGASDAELASVKRQIDRLNQQRNDLTERIDGLLLSKLGKESSGEQHSETPGMIMDRLSILSLRLFHTREEMERENAPPGHAERNADRLALLDQQRTDLAACLERLWRQICSGERHFKQYRHFKMYNDPELNPVIYRSSRARATE
jgi:Protein of unknown function (DUF4254)